MPTSCSIRQRASIITLDSAMVMRPSADHQRTFRETEKGGQRTQGVLAYARIETGGICEAVRLRQRGPSRLSSTRLGRVHLVRMDRHPGSYSSARSGVSGVTITIPRIVPPDEKVVCKIEPITGSRFLVKQCRTQEEWSQITAQAQEQVRSFQMRAEQFALKSH